MATEKPSSKGQAWFCTTGLPSDIVIEVDDMSFHLHKFPLMSKSRKLHLFIREEEENQTGRAQQGESEGGISEERDEEEEGEQCQISLPDFPGGSETFEWAAKFCYGVKLELTASNVGPLRCAAEYLEMTEEFSEDNLISKTERFLTQSVFRNIKDCILALKSCDGPHLMPIAEVLAIPQRCIDSIASRASSSDPSSLFGWPVSTDLDPKPNLNPALWNGIQSNVRRKSREPGRLGPSAPSDSWFEDLTVLSLPTYKQLIAAMKERDLSSEIVECALIAYAKRTIPGLSRSSRKQPASGGPSASAAASVSEAEQRELVETVITNLPLKAKGTTTTRFLFGLLRTANILRASEPSRASLERRIAAQLEQATLDDLLMPSYSYLMETLYDVDCVERILAYFLDGLEERSAVIIGDGSAAARSPTINPVILVGKLMDGYLSEIASDTNLTVEKFYDLAVALPDHARLFDDGLYRAIDVYLKAHPGISEEDRDKLCGVMDCQKLTLEACTHAAQNERLPLRAVVQVLFFEQIQLRHAIAGSLLAVEGTAIPPPPGSSHSSHIDDSATTPPHPGDGEPWRAAIRENQVLRLDMDSMRSRVHELERECSTMRKTIQKIDPTAAGGRNSSAGGGGGGGGWSAFSKKFGCKFKTQVCDSQERSVVEAKKNRQQQRRVKQQESL